VTVDRRWRENLQNQLHFEFEKEVGSKFFGGSASEFSISFFLYSHALTHLPFYIIKIYAKMH